MIRTTNGFDRLSDGNLMAKMGSICNAITGNPFFPTLDKDVAALNVLKNQFMERVDVAKTGTRQDIAAKNATRAELIAKARALGSNVSAIADGNEEMLVSSGYPSTGPRMPRPPVRKPENVTVTTGLNPGQINMSLKKDIGATNYLFQHAQSIEGQEPLWISQSSTRVKCTISNLKSGVRYLARVIAAGKENQQVESSVFSIIAQ